MCQYKFSVIVEVKREGERGGREEKVGGEEKREEEKREEGEREEMEREEGERSRHCICTQTTA